MNSITVKKAVIYGTTTALGAAAGLGVLALALPLVRKIGLNHQSWPTRVTFAASGALVGLATPWIASGIASKIYGAPPISKEERVALDAAQRLIRSGGDLDQRLREAADEGHARVAELLLASGATQTPDEDGWTPLHYAAREGDEGTVAVLLASGATQTPDQDGWTPIHSAAYEGHEKTVKMLLAKGADRSAETSEGETALQMARRYGYGWLVALLTPTEAGS